MPGVAIRLESSQDYRLKAGVLLWQRGRWIRLRQMTRGEFVEDHTEAEDIGSRVDVLQPKLLRRHVWNCSHQDLRLEASRFGQFREAEVENPDHAVRPEHEVL